MIRSCEPKVLREGSDGIRAEECTCACKTPKAVADQKTPDSDLNATRTSLYFDVNDPT